MNGRTLGLALALVAPTPGFGPVMATAQNLGDRVRITIGEDRVVGSVVTIGQDSIGLLSSPTRFRAVAWESVDLLERRTGSRWLLGAAIGGGVLAGAGAIAVATKEPCTGFCIELVPLAAAFATLGIVGGLSGAVIGRLFSRWETIATDRAGAARIHLLAAVPSRPEPENPGDQRAGSHGEQFAFGKQRVVNYYGSHH